MPVISIFQWLNTSQLAVLLSLGLVWLNLTKGGQSLKQNLWVLLHSRATCRIRFLCQEWITISSERVKQITGSYRRATQILAAQS